MTHYFYPLAKLHSYLMLVNELYPDLFKEETFLQSKSDVQYALKCKQFTTLWKENEGTMINAWSRCNLQKEKAYATL